MGGAGKRLARCAFENGVRCAHVVLFCQATPGYFQFDVLKGNGEIGLNRRHIDCTRNGGLVRWGGRGGKFYAIVAGMKKARTDEASGPMNKVCPFTFLPFWFFGAGEGFSGRMYFGLYAFGAFGAIGAPAAFGLHLAVLFAVVVEF